MTTTLTKPATDALTDLVDTARALTDLVDTARARAERAGTVGQVKALNNIAQTLDGARTRLVEDGPEYLEAAWAFVDAGRRILADRAQLAEYRDRIMARDAR